MIRRRRRKARTTRRYAPRRNVSRGTKRYAKKRQPYQGQRMSATPNMKGARRITVGTLIRKEF